MALEYWFPCIDDLHNQGTEICTAIADGTGISTSTGGIFGNAQSFNATTNGVVRTIAKSHSSAVGTYCFWLYVRSFPANNSTWSNLCRIGSEGYANTILGVSLEGPSLFGVPTKGNVQKITHGLSANTWYHIAISYNGSKIKYYRNGIFVSEVSSTQGSAAASTSLTFGGYGSSKFNGMISDFRYYNTALSDKEIKEISKGLILHYLLDIADTVSPGYEQLEYIISNNGCCADLGYPTTATMSYEFKYASLSGSGWRAPFGAYESENHITTRILLNSSNQNTFMIYHYSKAGGGGQPNISNVTTGWDQTIEGFLTPTAYELNNLSTGNSFHGTPDQVSGTVTQNHLHLGCTGITNAVSNFKIYYLRVLQNNKLQHYYVPCKRLSDNALGFFDIISKVFYPKADGANGTFTAGPKETNAIIINNIDTIYDTSGYCNNGTINIQPSAILSTPRYLSAMHFGEVNTPKITLNNFSNIKSNLTNCTVSWWEKLNGGKKSRVLFHGDSQYNFIGAQNSTDMLYSGNLSNSVTNNIKVYYDGVLKTTTTTNTGSYYRILTSDITRTDGLWHHVVYTGIRLVTYPSFIINGYSGYPVNDGELSDIRIYATELSTDDVLELYNTSMSIDSNGNILPRVLTS